MCLTKEGTAEGEEERNRAHAKAVYRTAPGAARYINNKIKLSAHGVGLCFNESILFTVQRCVLLFIDLIPLFRCHTHSAQPS